MRKIIEEILEIDIDEKEKKEKKEFIRNYIARELGKDERAQKILSNAIKEATKGKKLEFQESK